MRDSWFGALALPLSTGVGSRVAVADLVLAFFGWPVPHLSSSDRQVPSGSTSTDSTEEGQVLRMSSKYLFVSS